MGPFILLELLWLGLDECAKKDIAVVCLEFKTIPIRQTNYGLNNFRYL